MVDSNYTGVLVCVCIAFLFFFFLFLINLKLFLNRKIIIDREWDNFYQLILLIRRVRLNCWLLIQKMRFYFLKIFFV